MRLDLRYLIPAAIFAVLGAALVWALTGSEGGRRNPALVPSALIGKPAPEFALPPLPGYETGLAKADLAGKVAVVNVFASWCAPCLAEHPLLMRLAKEQGIAVFGINYKNRETDALAWLKEHGDPFARIGADRDGRVAIDWGVYGVPETFVVDRGGIVRYRHVGAITEDLLRDEIRPLLAKLKQ